MILLCLVLPAGLWAEGQAEVKEFPVSAGDNLISSVPAQSFADVWVNYHNGRHVFSRGTYSIGLSEDKKNITMKFRSDIYDYTYTFRENMRLVEGECNYKAADLVTRIHCDTIKLKSDEKENRLLLRYYLKGKQVNKKEIDYAWKIVPTDVLSLFFQTLLINGRKDSFVADTVIEEDGSVLNVTFTLVNMKQFKSVDGMPAYPARFRDFLKKQKDVYLYIMELNGVARLFFPHKYYFLYRNNEAADVLAYWGGKPEEADFVIIQE